MIREMTLGQYYPADSVIHRLDPRVKLAGTLIFIITIFIINDPAAYVFAALFLGFVIVLSKVPFRYMVKGLKTIVIILLFTVALNLFLTPGTEIWRFHFLKITREGVVLAVKMAVRFIFLVLGASLMTLTTTPNHLTDGLEKSLSPFRKIGLPVHEIAMMMSIALRFIPILLEETDKIMKVQQARCADFESGNLVQRAKSLVPVLVPLFISSFRRANDLAMAMEARCYHGGEGRTKMKPLKYYRRDYIAYFCLLIFLVVSILLNIFWGKLF